MGRRQEHAIVIGASIAGLCAARVLSDFYDQVTVFERDTLPDAPVNRSAVPQGRHLHLLMARGAAEFEALFDGLLDDMVEGGVPILRDQPGAIHFGAAGHVLGIPSQLRETFTTYLPSRPYLEWQVRRRTSWLPNVAITPRSVSVPRHEPGLQRVTGVMLDGVGALPGKREAPARRGEFVAADLVVDASGRGSRLPVWLSEWGYGRPPEHTVDVGIGYASRLLLIEDGLIEEKVIVAGASREQPLGLGMLYCEDGTWVLTTFGVNNVEPPQDFAEMCAVAEKILPANHAAAIRRGEPVGEVAFHKYPQSRWRRYDKLTRFPSGIVPFGDAVASFNPTYGQGMTMTSLQAGHLRRALQKPGADLGSELNRATAKTTLPVWIMNAVGDLILHRASGPIPRWYPWVGELFDQLLGAAETEPVLAEWFLRRFSLLDSLYMIPPARIIGRTVAHNMACWWAERRAQKGSSSYLVRARSRSGSR